MKQARKLTRNEKELLRNKYSLKPDDWQFLDDCRDETGRPLNHFKIINKSNGQIRIVDKLRR